MPESVTFPSSSKFFPPPYQPDTDGPPISMFETATQKLLLILRGLPDPYTRDTIQQEHLRLLTNSPGYAAFFLTSIDRRPQLCTTRSQSYVPERVADDPWKLLVAVMLLNKTAGRVAVPVFWTLMERWPTPEALAQADHAELEDRIRCLGLQSTRAKRLIALSAAYLDCPATTEWQYLPEEQEQSTTTTKKRRPEPPTPVSHLPGSGPYALDSYRIYCGGPGAWRTVMPSDKELVRYIKWRWAADGVQWSPTLGVIGHANETYLEQLIHELVALDPYARQ
ncbi:DNA glycosylase [Lactarius psammicola]|nr:DNA glycosylase [Lactarius psammicola]